MFSFKMKNVFGNHQFKKLNKNIAPPPQKQPYIPPIPKKLNNILFTNARDEYLIKEWVIYHLLIGFEHIVIFDHLSKIPITQTLGKLGKWKNKVTIIPIKDTHIKGLKQRLMTRALVTARRNQANWMMYLDADEYLHLHLPEYSSVNKYLQEATKHKINLIGVNWVMFGSSNLKSPDNSKLLIENYIQSDNTVNMHVKSFVQVKYARGVLNPHTYMLYPGGRIANMNLKHIGGAPSPFHRTSLTYDKLTASVHHYINQSESDYTRRKISLPSDDIGHYRSKKIPDNFHKLHNEIENTVLRDTFASKLKNELISLN